jgi:hypothetical protein
MCDSQLHDTADEFVFAQTSSKMLLHALICLERVDKIECQHPKCLLPTREFARSSRGRGTRDCLTFDHIEQQQHGGSHRPENMRIVHFVCNCAWARGTKGVITHTDQSRALLAEAAMRQHAEGRGPNYHDPVRLAKISAGHRGKTISPEARAKISEGMKRAWAEGRAGNRWL